MPSEIVNEAPSTTASLPNNEKAAHFKMVRVSSFKARLKELRRMHSRSKEDVTDSQTGDRVSADTSKGDITPPSSGSSPTSKDVHNAGGGDKKKKLKFFSALLKKAMPSKGRVPSKSDPEVATAAESASAETKVTEQRAAPPDIHIEFEAGPSKAGEHASMATEKASVGATASAPPVEAIPEEPTTEGAETTSQREPVSEVEDARPQQKDEPVDEPSTDDHAPDASVPREAESTEPQGGAEYARDDDVAAAAIKIQSCVRGHRVRMTEAKPSVETSVMPAREQMADGEHTLDSEDAAAIKIQSLARGHRARGAVGTKVAAIPKHSTSEQHTDDAHTEPSTEEQVVDKPAVAVVEAAESAPAAAGAEDAASLSSNPAENMHAAAVKIQSGVRGHRVRAATESSLKKTAEPSAEEQVVDKPAVAIVEAAESAPASADNEDGASLFSEYFALDEMSVAPEDTNNANVNDAAPVEDATEEPITSPAHKLCIAFSNPFKKTQKEPRLPSGPAPAPPPRATSRASIFASAPAENEVTLDVTEDVSSSAATAPSPQKIGAPTADALREGIAAPATPPALL